MDENISPVFRHEWHDRITRKRLEENDGKSKVETSNIKMEAWNLNLVTRASHYNDISMTSLITSFTIVYSTVYSDADKRKHQSSASLAFVWGNHRGPVNSPHKWPVTRKGFPFDDVIMFLPLACCLYSGNLSIHLLFLSFCLLMTGAWHWQASLFAWNSRNFPVSASEGL